MTALLLLTATMIRTHLLGHPRIGAQRELKFALERHWRGDIDAAALDDVGRALRRRHWAAQRDRGLDFVAVGDFSLYDHVADHIALFGCEPARFGFTGRETALARYFTMARGVATEAKTVSACGHDHGHDGSDARAGTAALEMTKWFDTNYHHLVPEFAPTTTFTLHAERLLAQVQEAQQLGHTPKPVLLGPLTFLWLGKSTTPGFDRLDLLEELLLAYRALLDRLAADGVTWVQIDEPILGLDLPGPWAIAYQRAYQALASAKVSLLLATYFSSLAPHISMACRLPVAGLHVDLVRAPADLPAVLDWLPSDKVLSVGVVDGRNIWRTDLAAAVALLRDVAERRRGEIWIAPSCSLLHVPTRLADDASLDPEVRGWLAGAEEKLEELATLKLALQEALNGGNEPSAAVQQAIAAAGRARSERAASPRVRHAAVAARLAALPEHGDRRASPFAVRQPLQRARLGLPAFPTTTIGSFPQTGDIRGARAAFKRGVLDAASYRTAMQREIAHAVRQQEAIGLDVLVHGEAERNDMVEYFGEQLDGFAFTANGWVQSYGSRCVKPPVLYGDVARPQAMTVDWATYAQSLTDRPMKGMLTGPITILQWSFVRDDQPRATTALQIALAMRDEVVDLEAAGIRIIQIDEPALREGLPLRVADRQDYLRWATHAFRVAASGVGDATQIHTHMCYAEFNDILPAIASLDADVITIETSRSDADVLRGFGDFRYPNEIGPGVYDIHSPNVPTVEAMRRLMLQAAEVLPPGNLWVNPDCGLKTRGWQETEAALRNMVQAARELRRSSADHEATSPATQST